MTSPAFVPGTRFGPFVPLNLSAPATPGRAVQRIAVASSAISSLATRDLPARYSLALLEAFTGQLLVPGRLGAPCLPARSMVHRGRWSTARTDGCPTERSARTARREARDCG